MKFIDLYAGIGGFRYALESAGHKCVFSSEINSKAIETYKKNFNILSEEIFFDMNNLNKMSNEEINNLIPDHDILTAGFPCQTFSVGGKKTGFDPVDTRGTQFFNILKILEVKKPKYILLENVKGIVGHDNGKTYKIIKDSLTKLGYLIPENPLILSPSQFGIPQRRERCFFPAKLNSKALSFPQPIILKNENNIINHNFILIKETLLENHIQYYLEAWEEFVSLVKKNNDLIPIIWIDEMISNEWNDEWQDWKKRYVLKMRTFYSNNKKIIDAWIEKYNVTEWNNKKFRKLEWLSKLDDGDFKTKIITIRQSGFRISRNNIFPTLVASVEKPIIWDQKNKIYRYLSIDEAKNLLSLPKEFKQITDFNSTYKQLGNSVNVDVVKYLIKHLIKE